MTKQENRQDLEEAAAALRELEQVQRELEAARRQHREAVDRFDAFLRGSRAAVEERPRPVGGEPEPAPLQGHQTSPSPDPAQPRRAGEGDPPAIAATSRPDANSSHNSPDVGPPTSRLPEGPGIFGDADEVAALSRAASHGSRMPWLAAPVAVLAIAGAVVWTRASRPPAPEAAPAAALQEPVPASASAVDPLPAALPDAATALPSRLGVELTTTRPVWLRVTVDGERVAEREVPAGERLHFEADETIVVRAGDAGAVRISVDDADARALGADGQVVTRTVTRSP